MGQQDRPADEVRLLYHQVDGLALGHRGHVEAALFVCGTARIHEVSEAALVDELFEELARRRVFGEVVLQDVDAVLGEEGDRLPAGGSGRLEIELALHCYRTHHAAALAADAVSGRWMASSSIIC